MGGGGGLEVRSNITQGCRELFFTPGSLLSREDIGRSIPELEEELLEESRTLNCVDATLTLLCFDDALDNLQNSLSLECRIGIVRTASLLYGF